MRFVRFNAIRLISVICSVLLFALTIVLVVEFISIFNLKHKEQSLQTRLGDVEQTIVDVTNQNNYLSSNEYLEDYAREVLGWGKNGEVIFK